MTYKRRKTMNLGYKALITTLLGVLILLVGVLTTGHTVLAGVTAEEAEQLKTTLTPTGGERAGNKEGSIPAWEGGYTTVPAGFDPNGRRPDPFADDKPVFSISAQNLNQYADKLPEGMKALLKKYASERLDVYKTRRTGAAPKWVYDNTFKNATRGTMVNEVPTNVFGGYPFPIPKTGAEVLWNRRLQWTGTMFSHPVGQWLYTADGKLTLLGEGREEHVSHRPFYSQVIPPEKYDGTTEKMMWTYSGPPVRVGEALLALENLDPDKDRTFLYLPGQRRVRQLPNCCCDTPNPSLAGLYTFDDTWQWWGRIDRYDWKIVGKKEMYVPYNENRVFKETNDQETINPATRSLKSELRRWELHRVWIIEGTLRQGERHVAPRVTLYVDEDTWCTTHSDRYDAKGQLWKISNPSLFLAPEMPGLSSQWTLNLFDLTTNVTYFIMLNRQRFQIKFIDEESIPASFFTPEGLEMQSIR